MSRNRSREDSRHGLTATLAGALVVAAILALPGCGGSDKVTSVTPTPTPVPTPKPAYVVIQGSGLSLRAGFIGNLPFSTTESGTVTITVDWTFARNDLDVFLARGACTPDQFNNDQCQLISFSVSTSAKPEKVTAPGLAAGAYTMLVGNAGPDDESLSFQVVLQPGAAGSSSAARDTSSLPEKARAYRNAIELPRP